MFARQDREQGAVLITVAVALIVLVGFTALAIDGGIAYGERRTTQNAADHAALAAAWAECTGGDPVLAAEASAAANGFIATDVQIVDVGGGEFAVQVTAVQDTTFGGAIGPNRSRWCLRPAPTAPPRPDRASMRSSPVASRAARS